jgi:hypothetical protein
MLRLTFFACITCLACGGSHPASSQAKPAPPVAAERRPSEIERLEPDAEVQVGYDAAALRDRATHASLLVLELARERDWQRSGVKAAQALRALASTIEVAPLSLPRERWRAVVYEIRYQALELERDGALSLDRSNRVKAALTACNTAIENLVRGKRFDSSPLVAANASAAASAIDPDSMFVFQRGIIQEAMRSVADTFLIASTSSVGASSSAAL